MSKVRRDGAVGGTPGLCELALLDDLFQRPAVRERRVVLDVGGPGAARVAFHQKNQSRVVMLGLEHALGAPRTRLDLIDALHAGRHPINVILLWDLINYLEADFVGELLGRVYDVAAPGLLCHALVSSLGNKVAARPTRYVPDPDCRGVRPVECDSVVDAPRTSAAQLLKLLPGFEVDKGRMLDMGYCEYLMRWTGGRAAQAIVPKSPDEVSSPKQSAPIIRRVTA